MLLRLKKDIFSDMSTAQAVEGCDKLRSVIYTLVLSSDLQNVSPIGTRVSSGWLHDQQRCVP